MPALQENPPELQHAAPIWVKNYIKELRQWLMDNRTIGGLNCLTVDTPGGGKRIDVGRVPATVQTPFPFQVNIFGTKYEVNLGTINNLVPSGLASQHSFTPGDAVLLTAVTDGKQILSASVAVGPLPAPPDCVISTAPTNFKVPLALLQSASVQQIVFNNLAAIKTLCHQTEKSFPISPVGTSPWTNWWTWTVVPELTPQLFPLA